MSKRKSRQRYDWLNVQNENRTKWEEICPAGEYRILPSNVLLGILPNALINQYSSVFIMASGTASGNVYYMANGNRVDFPDSSIDQMPFGLAFVEITQLLVVASFSTAIGEIERFIRLTNFGNKLMRVAY